MPIPTHLLTPVRIRGKRGNREAIRKVIKANETFERELERKERELEKQERMGLAEPTTISSPKCYLESLPTEILQEIFLLRPNFSLTRASPILRAQLSSTHIRTSLVLRYFDPHDEEDDDNIAEVQSMMLKQPWFTYDFVRQCQHAFLTSTAKRQLRAFLDAGSCDWEYQKTQLADLESDLTGLWERAGLRLGAEKPDPFQCTMSHRFQRPSNDKFFSVVIDFPGNRYGCLISSLEHTRKGLGNSEPGGRPDAKVSIFPYLQRKSSIPARLLRGPWTQADGNLLELLAAHRISDGYSSRARARASVTSSLDLTAASEGLLTAIKQHCLPALKLFRIHVREECPLGPVFGGGNPLEDVTSSWQYLRTIGAVSSSYGLHKAVPEARHMIACLNMADETLDFRLFFDLYNTRLDGNMSRFSQGEHTEIAKHIMQKKSEAKTENQKEFWKEVLEKFSLFSP